LTEGNGSLAGRSGALAYNICLWKVEPVARFVCPAARIVTNNKNIFVKDIDKWHIMC
jgi:hypothetical protein